MKVTSNFLKRFHLDPRHGLLSGRNVQLILELFKALDVKKNDSMDDVQFLAFMRNCTDLNDRQILKVFEIFDVDNSGSIDFNEFYLLVCILIAIKDKEEKLFLSWHSRTCFELLDEDGSKTVSSKEFETFGFLFNFGRSSIKQIFKEYDVSGDKELDYNEFRMFTFACIDLQQQLDKKNSQHRKCVVM